MDKIYINDLKFETIIGTLPWEQQLPQLIQIDLCLAVDAKKIAKSDDLEQTVNYVLVANTITEYASNNKFKLIETLAENLCQLILNNFATSWVQLTIFKPGALDTAKSVAISIERSS